MSRTAESPEFIQNIVESLRTKEQSYQAGDDIYNLLGNRTMTAIAGPTASGKTSVAAAIVAEDSDFKEVETTTTRPHRLGDPAGFITNFSYESFNDAVINAHLVNFNVIGQNLYGTYQSGFTGLHNVGPIMSRSIPQMLHAGFRDINVAYMLVEEQEYEERLRRERASFPDFTARIIEAGESREFVINNIDANWLHFVENSQCDEGAAKAARKVIDITRRNTKEVMTNDRARSMLSGMQAALLRVARNV